MYESSDASGGVNDGITSGVDGLWVGLWDWRSLEKEGGVGFAKKNTPSCLTVLSPPVFFLPLLRTND